MLAWIVFRVLLLVVLVSMLVRYSWDLAGELDHREQNTGGVQVCGPAPCVSVNQHQHSQGNRR